MPGAPQPFRIDEQYLRDQVLRAYHENREAGDKSAKVLAAIRQFLSGAPGAAGARRYWFEEDPPASIASFAEDLELTEAGLARLVLQPLLEQAQSASLSSRRELVDNLAVYVSSQAGAVAVKARLDETLAAGLVAAAIIGIHRTGPEPFLEVLG